MFIDIILYKTKYNNKKSKEYIIYKNLLNEY